MRSVLILSALAALALLSACNDQSKGRAAPERGNAAGEVLGGEISDAMLPLDSARSTSPPDVRPVAANDNAQPRDTNSRPTAPTQEGRQGAPPEPETTATPVPSPIPNPG